MLAQVYHNRGIPLSRLFGTVSKSGYTHFWVHLSLSSSSAKVTWRISSGASSAYASDTQATLRPKPKREKGQSWQTDPFLGTT